MDDSLYVSFSPGEYRKNKSHLLNSKIDILNIMKHQENINRIKSKKSELQAELNHLMSEVSAGLKKIENKIPKPKIPKKLREKNKTPKKPRLIPEELEDTSQSIEQELMEVRGKLRELNG